MGTCYKGGATSYHSIKDNIPSTSNSYTYNNGYFGEKGKAKKDFYSQIETSNPIEESKKFYDTIAYGGIEKPMSNGKGYITELKDGTIISYREVTSTEGSPAVEINIKKSTDTGGVKKQKIHFEKRKK